MKKANAGQAPEIVSGCPSSQAAPCARFVEVIDLPPQERLFGFYVSFRQLRTFRRTRLCRRSADIVAKVFLHW
jgi:hypothetical protein